MPFAVYLARLNDDEEGFYLPEIYVPTTFYCGFIGTEIVGRLTLRHQLNEQLRETGGNIGYIVVPEYRRRGIATDMLRLALPLARQRGLDRVLITSMKTTPRRGESSRSAAESWTARPRVQKVASPNVGIGLR
jgi:predicted acetyltransferase